MQEFVYPFSRHSD